MAISHITANLKTAMRLLGGLFLCLETIYQPNNLLAVYNV